MRRCAACPPTPPFSGPWSLLLRPCRAAGRPSKASMHHQCPLPCLLGRPHPPHTSPPPCVARSLTLSRQLFHQVDSVGIFKGSVQLDDARVLHGSMDLYLAGHLRPMGGAGEAKKGEMRRRAVWHCRLLLSAVRTALLRPAQAVADVHQANPKGDDSGRVLLAIAAPQAPRPSRSQGSVAVNSALVSA